MSTKMSDIKLLCYFIQEGSVFERGVLVGFDRDSLTEAHRLAGEIGADFEDRDDDEVLY